MGTAALFGLEMAFFGPAGCLCGADRFSGVVLGATSPRVSRSDLARFYGMGRLCGMFGSRVTVRAVVLLLARWRSSQRRVQISKHQIQQILGDLSVIAIHTPVEKHVTVCTPPPKPPLKDPQPLKSCRKSRIVCIPRQPFTFITIDKLKMLQERNVRQ